MPYKLSAKAKAAKKKRDLKAAKTKVRKNKKADSQVKRRKYKKINGKNSLKGKDYDHKDKRFESVKANRGNDGKGTKKEGNKTKRKKK